MLRAVAALTVVLFAFAGCRKEGPAPAAPPPAEEPEFFVDRTPDGGTPASAEVEHPADEIGEVAAPDVKVTEALVLKYLAYRKVVVERGREAVAKVQQEEKSLNLTQRAEHFAVTMRAIEEKARAEAGLSRDEVVAVGQVTGEVFAARQIWRMNGGDEVLEKARATLATMTGDAKAKAAQALARNEQSFAQMKNAASARKRFGDEAVDAVLAHEDALWKVQQEGAKVMSAVF
ncbi:MAG: hypothetical protein IRZ16_05990 [Myxococcaceae bacterium]|nr:hypothetical protein [Myxococcaceae bacterium]